MSRYLLLGESPNAATVGRPDLWLLPDESGVPHSANRLLFYLGWDLKTFLDTFDRDNVLRDLPPRAGRGRAFPIRQARERAAEIARRAELEHAGIVVLGKRAASAFTWVPHGRPDFLEWSHVAIEVDGVATALSPACIVPHPSGINAWWNSSENRRRAREFFHTQVLT